MEVQARRCYFEPIMLSSDDFVEMLLLDGSFILEIFLKKFDNCRGVCTESAPISENSWVIHKIPFDLLLLENQIPFFILQTLFDCLNLIDVNVSFMIIVIGYFRQVDLSLMNIVSVDHDANIYHLLHLVHHYNYPPVVQMLEQKDATKSTRKSSPLIPKGILQWLNPLSLLPASMNHWFSLTGDQRNDKENSFSPDTVPCAKRLQEAGITFKKKTSALTFIDITFNKGVLEIPHICIDDSTGRLLMNLVTFEQSNLPMEKRLLTCYMSFMDDIIDTAEDVEILERNGILESFLNSDSETALYFNHIVDYATLDSSSKYLASVYDQVNKYTKASWPRWRAKFVREYIFSPWAVFSLKAALLLITLAFVQTIFTVFAYYHH